jgi:hypothetical protein
VKAVERLSAGVRVELGVEGDQAAGAGQLAGGQVARATGLLLAQLQVKQSAQHNTS